MRVDVARVKSVLADLEQMTPATTAADDFVDLAETAEFKPEIQEGECSRVAGRLVALAGEAQSLSSTAYDQLIL